MLSILSALYVCLSLAFLRPAQAQKLAKTSHQKIFFVNVGQGDFTLLSLNTACWVFDPGGESSQISQSLQNLLSLYCSKKYLNVAISHFDRDHYAKVKGLSRLGHLQNFYYSNSTPHSQYGKKLLNDLKQMFPQSTQVIGSKKILTGGVEISLTAPPIELKKRIENDWSLVVKIKTYQKTILITGDAPHKTQLLATNSIDVLRVAHHGSAHNTSSKLIKELKPKTCVISAGHQNSYGHPHPKVLDALAKNRCAILRTDRLGTIEMEL